MCCAATTPGALLPLASMCTCRVPAHARAHTCSMQAQRVPSALRLLSARPFGLTSVPTAVLEPSTSGRPTGVVAGAPPPMARCRPRYRPCLPPHAALGAGPHTTPCTAPVSGRRPMTRDPLPPGGCTPSPRLRVACCVSHACQPLPVRCPRLCLVTLARACTAQAGVGRPPCDSWLIGMLCALCSGAARAPRRLPTARPRPCTCRRAGVHQCVYCVRPPAFVNHIPTALHLHPLFSRAPIWCPHPAAAAAASSHA